MQYLCCYKYIAYSHKYTNTTNITSIISAIQYIILCLVPWNSAYPHDFSDMKSSIGPKENKENSQNFLLTNYCAVSI